MKNIQNRISIIYFLFAVIFLLNTSIVSAHVAVKPNEVGAAAFQTFTVGVPVEKEIPTTGLRVAIPEGLQHVTPNVKQGWTIDVKKSGTGEEAAVTEIIWSGGSIPAGQRDEFLFSAQVPATETTLQWKAYQTYEDGTVVAWDQDPKQAEHGKDDGEHEANPFSETKVLTDVNASATHVKLSENTNESWPTILSIAAIIMAGGALYLQTRKK